MGHRKRIGEPRRYHIVDVEERAELHPGRFQIPELEQRRNLGPDFVAKLVFEVDPPPEKGPSGERMWVSIEERQVSTADGKICYRGRLRNEPFMLEGVLAYDALLYFEPRHIADYEVAPDDMRPKPPRPPEDPVVDPYGHAGDPKRPS